ncbi:FtsX-like permease family protein [Sarcina ventriculi]|uniref:Acidobacterial duplicated orphan permease n=1 Tax=Sarcina ventriculi TaxID=1267 RepID=A0ABM9URD1_SARVE|nr:FtsX-like permease family protein [Sarcina ventriculi]MBU5323021.1 FtsX-like permease family protein [Sarcina ventriculi]MDD7373830.1 FtsX-like permease family protein [Sarcina ventriculi]CUO06864.1 acidobacterial duplicated orphan permease [Sarcina ventriculi]
MYSKIALNSVKKSFKDYTIYFLTLTFAVCIFYSFNSIESQKAMLDLTVSQKAYMKLFSSVISIASVFVSFILGALIIYANNFLIKKRKKEMGIYITLGMPKRKVSNILLLETVLIGIISLGIGLILGVVLSQGLSILTAKLFMGSMTSYQFAFSIDAVLKTILYFGIIFLLVMIFNTVIISKYKLIDLLNASKKNEKIKMRNPVISSIIFCLAVIFIVVAYIFINKSGLNIESIYFQSSMVLGVIGTFLFFFGLSGIVLYVIQRSKNIYLKNLNIFIVRQISSKFNTNFLSMSLICLMLFITTVMLSSGLGFKNTMEQGVKKNTPFDASIEIYYSSDSVSQANELTQVVNNQLSKYTNKSYIAQYQLNDVSMRKMLLPYVPNTMKKAIDNSYNDYCMAVSISQYNKMRELEGQKPINLANNDVLVLSNVQKFEGPINDFIKNNGKIDINGTEYKVQNDKAIEDSLYSSGMAINTITLVVPDKIVQNLIPYTGYINVNYTGSNAEKKTQESNIEAIFNKLNREKPDGYIGNGYTRTQLYEQSLGLSAIVIYLSIYLGIVFLIASAAVLALQQLSEASDSINRYKALRKIGVTDKMINKSIFIQTLIYFGAPLALAIVHSIVAIYVVNDFISALGSTNIIISALITLVFILLIYSGYFYATYTSYKRIIKNNK